MINMIQQIMFIPRGKPYEKLKNFTAKTQRENAKGAKTSNTMMFFAFLAFSTRGLGRLLRLCGKKVFTQSQGLGYCPCAEKISIKKIFKII